MTWHLRKAWAPLTYTDEHPPARDNPVAPARRSRQAHAKAAHKHDIDGAPLHSFGGLLKHLATLTRNTIRYQNTDIDVPTLTEPTPTQRRAFQLIGATIPPTGRVARTAAPTNQQNTRSSFTIVVCQELGTSVT